MPRTAPSTRAAAAPLPAAAALASGLLLLLLALAVPRGADADATALATTILNNRKDIAGCGGLDSPCCLHSGKPCASADLVCAPLAAQDLRCRPCGGEGQPPCQGGCEDDLEVLRDDNVLPFPVCVQPSKRAVPAAPKQGVVAASGNVLGAALGAVGARVAAGPRGRSDSILGQLLGGKCAATSDCKAAHKVCAAGVCVACGSLNRPCCEAATAPPCKDYGAGGRVQCVREERLGASFCRAAPEQE